MPCVKKWEMKMTYKEAVNYLNETAGFAKKNKLEHIKYLMECLGNPQREIRFVHVAGTNGKGSVCAFLEAFLLEKGWTTGVFPLLILYQSMNGFALMDRMCRMNFLQRHAAV